MASVESSDRGDKQIGPLLYLALAAAITCAAGALRVYQLDWQSVWQDEIYSLTVADPSRSFDDFWQRVLADVHPPLYYLILRFWLTLVGDTQLAARALSVLFGVGAVAVAGFGFRTLLPPFGRIAFTLLIAVSPAAIEYSQEVRSYSLLLLLCTLIAGLSVGVLAARSPEEIRRRAAGLIVVGALASFTHHFGFLLAMAAVATCLAAPPRDRPRTVAALTGGIVLGAIFLPWIAYHSRFMSDGFRLAIWIGYMPIGASIDWFVRLAFGTWSAFGFLFAALVAALLTSGAFRRCISRSLIVRAAFGVCTLTLAAAVAISFHTPVLTSRNMVVVIPALYLLMAEAAGYCRSRLGTRVAVTLLLVQAALIAQALVGYYAYMAKPQWRESAQFVTSQPRCEAAAIHVYGDALYYRYFTEKTRPAVRLIEIPEWSAADLSGGPRSECPIVLWVANLWREELDYLLPSLSIDPSSVEIIEFDRAFVVLRLSDP
jgi:uncharacterized membrane protein